MTKLEIFFIEVKCDGVTFMIFGFSFFSSNILLADKSVLKKWDPWGGLKKVNLPLKIDFLLKIEENPKRDGVTL